MTKNEKKLTEEMKQSKLYRFLKKHKVIRAFRRNLKAQSKTEHPFQSIEEKLERIGLKTVEEVTFENILLTIGNTTEGINFSFTWEDTPEGDDFWAELDYEFSFLQ